MCTRAPRMHDTLRNALMIKMHDFFAQDVIFKQRRSAAATTQGILIVADAQTLVGGE